MAAEEGNIVRGIYTGEEQPEEWEDEDGEVRPVVLPRVTHLSVHDSITVIRRDAFNCHPNLVELICHDAFNKIEEGEFSECHRLKRAVLPGVEEVEAFAFIYCFAIEHVECGKLEIIGEDAFRECRSLESIDLPSAKIVQPGAFWNCKSLRDVKFGEHLDYLGFEAFYRCTALERITIPLKNGVFGDHDVFTGCDNLGEVFLVEGAITQETVDALLLDEWKKDMNKELDSINHTLPNTNAGGKTRAIRDWVERVQQKIIHYKVEHYRLLSLAAAALAHASPNEIVINNVLSFLELPDHVFEGEGVNSATTPTFDKYLWENALQTKQRLLEKDAILSEKETEIASLKAQNDEKEDENHQLKLRVAQLEQRVAESGEAIEKNDADGLSQKRPRRT